MVHIVRGRRFVQIERATGVKIQETRKVIDVFWKSRLTEQV